MNSKWIYSGLLGIVMLGACKKDDDNTDSVLPPPVISTDVPDVYKKVYGATNIYIENNTYVVFQSNGLPDHKSPYYQGTQWSATKYEAYNGTNPQWAQNPNKIGQVNYTFRIPLNPQEAATKSATPMGPMGIALNGVPLFNQYAAGRQPLTGEINSFDQYNGHPAQGSDYHYHMEPSYITSVKGKETLIGFLLDGFPVYGPMENGQAVPSSVLDAYHGHNHATLDFPDGIYHYHITADAPYINGDGFWGTPGSVSK